VAADLSRIQMALPAANTLTEDNLERLMMTRHGKSWRSYTLRKSTSTPAF